MSQIYDGSIFLCVFVNIIVISLNGYLFDPADLDLVNKFNNAFAIIFTIDMGLRLISFGIQEYVQDIMNIFDAIMTIIYLVEYIMWLDGNGLIAIQALKLFIIGRIVRYFPDMKKVIRTIQKSMQNMFSILVLLAIFMYFYTLLGYQIYHGNYINPPYRDNYDDGLFSSFLCTLQVTLFHIFLFIKYYIDINRV